MEEKTCSKCKKVLPLTPFYFHKGESKSGFKSACKVCRGYKFGETKQKQKRNVSWTDDEINFMINFYDSSSNDEIALILSKTLGSIDAKARFLHLYKENWWNDEEKNILFQYYPIMKTEDLKQSLLKNRSNGSINKKAMELGIKKNHTILENIRANNLEGYSIKGLENLNWSGAKGLRDLCRNRLANWINNIKIKYNNKCYITGESTNLIVHHVVSFKSIFDNAISEFTTKYNFPIYEDVLLYYKNNLETLLEQFVDLIVRNHKLSDGVLIKKDIHDLFHNLYGTRYCSPKDYLEFENKLFNGDFDNTLNISFEIKGVV